MSKNRLKFLYDKKPDEKKVTPLLNPELEQQRLTSIEKQKEEEKKLAEKSYNLNKLLFGGK